MSDSDTSSLSSAPPTDEDEKKLAPIFLKAKGKGPKKVPSSPATTASPPKPTRPPSPPHEEALADNPNIAFLVMFRSRFSAAFPSKLPHYGPQDIENGIVGSVPSPQVEDLLCALLGLVMNRKKPVERGHHGRALEEAISTHKGHWPKTWNGTNPLPGTKTFNDLTPVDRLDLLRTLVLWSLSSSDIISATIKDSYKQSRHEDDLNQPLSVQPWGIDGDKRRFWLIEGQDDTNFRVYRESNRANKNITWWSVAGSIDEVKVLQKKLEDESSQASRRLAGRISAAIPRFEATEEKRRRREYRQFRRAQFSRPEPGFSLYEGRTRGKRMRYTFDDDDFDVDSDAVSTRRSLRQSENSTPAEAQGPTVTASGRQVRPRGGGAYGETLLSGQTTNTDTPMSDAFDQSDGSELPRNGLGRATRSGGRTAAPKNPRKRKHIDGYNSLDDMSDEDDALSSGNDWDGGDDEEDADDDGDELEDEENDEMSDEEEDDDVDRSLIVKLKLGQKAEPQTSGGAPSATPALNGHAKPEADFKVEPKTESHQPAHMTNTASLGVVHKPESVAEQKSEPLSVEQQPGHRAQTSVEDAVQNAKDAQSPQAQPFESNGHVGQPAYHPPAPAPQTHG